MPQPKRNGFTLIEALLVLAILAIFATVGYPVVYGMLEEESLDAAVHEVEVAIRHAHLLAVSTGNPTTVRIGAPNDSLIVQQARSHEHRDILKPGVDEFNQGLLETEVYERVRNLRRPSGLYEIGFRDDPRLHGIDIVASSFGPPGNSLRFDAFGKPSHGGTVTLAGAAEQVVIEVDGFTGRVTVR
jgi:prepilin-type N-terminal cleavage/methylation domain-containing protein